MNNVKAVYLQGKIKVGLSHDRPVWVASRAGLTTGNHTACQES